MRRMLPMILGVLTMAGCGEVAEPAGPDVAPGEALLAQGFGPAATATYAISVTNLTAGQPLTPPLAATHRKPVSMFTVGEPAGYGLQQIAENGNLAPMYERLSQERHVSDMLIAAGSPPPILPGETRSFELAIERGAKYLSWVSMLICTNDGFTGSDGLRLPDKVDETAVVYTAGYDAGTEMNTEAFEDLVPPCAVITLGSNEGGTGMTDPALAEDEVVRHHPGIQGIADLDPAIHGWTDPVAKVVVERIN